MQANLGQLFCMYLKKYIQNNILNFTQFKEAENPANRKQKYFETAAIVSYNISNNCGIFGLKNQN